MVCMDGVLDRPTGWDGNYWALLWERWMRGDVYDIFEKDRREGMCKGEYGSVEVNLLKMRDANRREEY